MRFAERQHDARFVLAEPYRCRLHRELSAGKGEDRVFDGDALLGQELEAHCAITHRDAGVDEADRHLLAKRRGERKEIVEGDGAAHVLHDRQRRGGEGDAVEADDAACVDVLARPIDVGDAGGGAADVRHDAARAFGDVIGLQRFVEDDARRDHLRGADAVVHVVLGREGCDLVILGVQHDLAVRLQTALAKDRIHFRKP
jgi:hypothetical protein